MITAKEAQKLVAGSETAINAKLAEIENYIISACKKGDYSIEVGLTEEFMLPIKKSIESFGYKAEQTHAKGLKITW